MRKDLNLGCNLRVEKCEYKNVNIDLSSLYTCTLNKCSSTRLCQCLMLNSWKCFGCFGFFLWFFFQENDRFTFWLFRCPSNLWIFLSIILCSIDTPSYEQQSKMVIRSTPKILPIVTCLFSLNSRKFEQAWSRYTFSIILLWNTTCMGGGEYYVVHKEKRHWNWTLAARGLDY